MEARENISIMMEVPKSVREHWLKEGFSETAAEAAALAMWRSMMRAGESGDAS